MLILKNLLLNEKSAACRSQDPVHCYEKKSAFRQIPSLYIPPQSHNCTHESGIVISILRAVCTFRPICLRKQKLGERPFIDLVCSEGQSASLEFASSKNIHTSKLLRKRVLQHSQLGNSDFTVTNRSCGFSL